MEIDSHFVTLSERRGISRARLGALIRMMKETESYCYLHKEANWALTKALSATHIDFANVYANSNRPFYDIPIARKISFREYHRGEARDINGTPMWTWSALVHLEDHDLPVATSITYVGKPLRALIDHPDLPGDRLVTAIGRMESGTAIALETQRIDAAVDLPSRHYREVLERRRLEVERKKDCIAAAAHVGFSIKGALFILLAPCFLGTAILNAWGLPLLTALSTMAALGCMLLVADTWLEEDVYLKERISRLRDDTLMRNQTAIQKGSDEAS